MCPAQWTCDCPLGNPSPSLDLDGHLSLPVPCKQPWSFRKLPTLASPHVPSLGFIFLVGPRSSSVCSRNVPVLCNVESTAFSDRQLSAACCTFPVSCVCGSPEDSFLCCQLTKHPVAFPTHFRFSVSRSCLPKGGDYTSRGRNLSSG